MSKQTLFAKGKFLLQLETSVTEVDDFDALLGI